MFHPQDLDDYITSIILNHQSPVNEFPNADVEASTAAEDDEEIDPITFGLCPFHLNKSQNDKNQLTTNHNDDMESAHMKPVFNLIPEKRRSRSFPRLVQVIPSSPSARDLDYYAFGDAIFENPTTATTTTTTTIFRAEKHSTLIIALDNKIHPEVIPVQVHRDPSTVYVSMKGELTTEQLYGLLFSTMINIEIHYDKTDENLDFSKILSQFEDFCSKNLQFLYDFDHDASFSLKFVFPLFEEEATHGFLNQTLLSSFFHESLTFMNKNRHIDLETMVSCHANLDIISLISRERLVELMKSVVMFSKLKTINAIFVNGSYDVRSGTENIVELNNVFNNYESTFQQFFQNKFGSSDEELTTIYSNLFTDLLITLFIFGEKSEDHLNDYRLITKETNFRSIRLTLSDSGRQGFFIRQQRQQWQRLEEEQEEQEAEEQLEPEVNPVNQFRISRLN